MNLSEKVQKIGALTKEAADVFYIPASWPNEAREDVAKAAISLGLAVGLTESIQQPVRAHEDVVAAARLVVDRWGAGDLTDAVRQLDTALQSLGTT